MNPTLRKMLMAEKRRLEDELTGIELLLGTNGTVAPRRRRRRKPGGEAYMEPILAWLREHGSGDAVQIAKGVGISVRGRTPSSTVYVALKRLEGENKVEGLKVNGHRGKIFRPCRRRSIGDYVAEVVEKPSLAEEER